MKEFHRRLSLHPSQDASLESERNGNALTELRSYPSVGERRGGGWGEGDRDVGSTQPGLSSFSPVCPSLFNRGHFLPKGSKTQNLRLPLKPVVFKALNEDIPAPCLPLCFQR